MRLAVIGAGAAGRAFALRCATAGLAVTLEDVMPEKLRRAQDEYLGLAEYGQLAAVRAAGSLRFASTVEDAVADADVAVDFVPDELESKLEIFSLLDRMAPPRTVLLTPTDTLSITDLASCTYRAEKCVGVRGGLERGPVTVLRSRFAEPEALASVEALLGQLGMASVVVEDTVDPMLVKNLAVR